jgi:general secretion pathway protein D
LNTSKSLWHFVALALVVAAPSFASAAAHNGVSLLVTVDAVSQFGKSKGASEREQAIKLMRQARAELKAGNFESAESLITTIEKMNPQLGAFHFGDTPRKLRADLKAAERTAARKPQRPSQKFTPEDPRSAAPTTPLARQTSAPQVPTEVLDPAEELPLSIPESSGMKSLLPLATASTTTPDGESAAATRLPNPTAPQSPVAIAQADAVTAPAGADGNRRQSDYQLLTARRALAVGDVRRASAAVEEARKLGVSYGLHDDSPEKVEAAIQKYQHLSEAIKGREDEAARRQMADLLMDQAQQLLRWKDYDEAERLVQHADGLGVNYGPFDVKPQSLAEKIAAARRQGGGHSSSQPKAYPAAQAVYEQGGDTTRMQAAAAQEELPPDAIMPEGEAEGLEPVPDELTPPLAPPLPGEGLEVTPEEAAALPSEAAQLYAQGEQALRKQDTQTALGFFRRAYELRDQLDPATAQRLQDHMQLLSAPPAASRGAKPEMLLDQHSSEQDVLARQVSNDLAKKEMAADKIREKQPKQAMEMLKEARAAVESSGLSIEQQGILTRRVDRKIADLDKYIIEHKAEIALDEQNKAVLDEVNRRFENRLVIDDKLAQIVNDCNQMMDEERFAEAEVLAKRARELDPENPVVKQLIWNVAFVKRTQRVQDIKSAKEDGYWQQMTNVENSATPFDDNEPYQFGGDARSWEELTKSRQERMADARSRRSERELEIEQKLRTPVSLKFRDRPLSEVLNHLATLAAVNLHLDPKGLEEEGVASDTPVTIDLSQDISLKSALNLILEPLRLSYVIQNEVLKITSEQLRDTVVVTRTYDVADLVIPIPNFAPSGRLGMGAAIADGYNMTGTGMGLGPGSAYLASANGANASGVIDPAVMAQISNLMPGGGGAPVSGMSQPISMGPGGVGGGAQADFDSLIELITTTVKPQTWDEVGGPGSISEFYNNLSLVISQTEDVHEEIVDLLEQLRRNQDLQVTIEVRFITLSDTFFERIGVDFDFNVVNLSANNNPSPLVPPRLKREVVGLEQNGQPTPDLSIPFTQESSSLAIPQFGSPVPVAQFGFAILSDLEAFLLVQAAQGDRRSNVLQAPKVTLFNGQQASVFDTTQQPFVISVIPVVGDFAAAYQPVITVLSEGTALTVQAVISHDRRFVRLTVLPLFSSIGDEVETFQFTGSTTTTKNTSESESTGGTSGDSTDKKDDATTSSDGVTVQLPNFSFVSVITTVSVPDGGTVLLGGIKRLSEGRNEFGVPILSKLPYINRLFKNVGIGRETQSLMMMVTPRIIIQEEEEERLGIQLPP